MAYQIGLNITIALVWTFLHDEWLVARFIVGYLIGIVLIWAIYRVRPGRFYMKKAMAVVYLLLLFLKELWVSSLVVVRQILRPKLSIRPGIFAMTTELETDFEITLLACLICLTPGTLTLEVGHDGQTLYIHAMDIEDADELSRQIKSSFERAIMEVTRA
ncbi:Na+/H+ antiporter subunit E [Paenibacillus sp. P96]|uniref:Na+/H+ antiporter subunit E n=1 Tax=Paenibacillus zeirhizosphaerae TaxID=2987519 RepID=A0ABT9FR59_9BACL|nr:Na+/H+ antiporter subunit E [Paenibacillus sp. P96]MDP4097219.1 Na+/H+ antiporter subunit E [Paenibacillus sp. P96]